MGLKLLNLKITRTEWKQTVGSFPVCHILHYPSLVVLSLTSLVLKIAWAICIALWSDPGTHQYSSLHSRLRRQCNHLRLSTHVDLTECLQFFFFFLTSIALSGTAYFSYTRFTLASTRLTPQKSFYVAIKSNLQHGIINNNIQIIVRIYYQNFSRYLETK